jgi:hypothetical protein
MTRRVKDPDAALAALHDKRLGLAVQRATLESAANTWARVVAEAPDRRRAVLLGEARGDTPDETVEQVDADRGKAEREIVGCRERAEALRTVEGEIDSQVENLIDAYPDHFVAKAVAASEAAQEALAAAAQAAQAAVLAWQEARAAWGTVRLSRNRRRLELSPEVPISDLGTATNELSKESSRPWPGGSRDAWERFLAHEQASKQAGRASNAEALAAFERIVG